MDVPPNTDAQAFLIVCVGCFNLGRLDHDVDVRPVDRRPTGNAIRFTCDTCGASYDREIDWREPADAPE